MGASELVLAQDIETSEQIISSTPEGAYSGFAADLDSDGIPDSYEAANNLDPNVNDAQADPDGDNLNNLQESQAGTAAHNPDSDGDGIGDQRDHDRLTASNDCSTDDNGNATYIGIAPAGQTTQCAATVSITVTGAPFMADGATLELISPEVRFSTGSSLPTGGQLQVDPSHPVPTSEP